MNYERIVRANFVSRPNRFIAYVDIGGNMEKVHVKNTGRCRELLVDRADVFLEESCNPARATRYDLVAVLKQDRMINMDSAAPNKAVGEWLAAGGLFENVDLIRPETVYRKSRFDFYVEAAGRKIFLEVKGVTLEKDNVALFPDAPSDRAVKHVNELLAAAQEGYDAYVIMVIQMENVSYFTPNEETHADFCQALRHASSSGVQVLAYDCKVWENGMSINRPVPVRL